MGEVVYGNRGNCPRCGDAVHQHAISSCSIDDATSKAVGYLISASKALAGVRMNNKEFMRQARVGDVTQQDANETADRMVGALFAQTTTGLNIKLTAISGGGGTTASVMGWTGVASAVPRGRQGWHDINGKSFEMPTLQGIAVDQPCAAIKLLLGLGEHKLVKSGTKFNFVHLYEEACRGDEAPGKKSKKLAKWKGQGIEYVYAAHSCRHCEARLPALLCDRASD